MSDETTKSDETTDEGRPVEDKIAGGEILEELTALGMRFSSAVQQAWESDQRRSIQGKVMEELKTAGDHVERLARRAGAAKPAAELSEGAEKLGRQVSDGLLLGLKALNRELSKAIEKREHDRSDEDDHG